MALNCARVKLFADGPIVATIITCVGGIKVVILV